MTTSYYKVSNITSSSKPFSTSQGPLNVAAGDVVTVRDPKTDTYYIDVTLSETDGCSFIADAFSALKTLGPVPAITVGQDLVTLDNFEILLEDEEPAVVE